MVALAVCLGALLLLPLTAHLDAGRRLGIAPRNASPTAAFHRPRATRGALQHPSIAVLHSSPATRVLGSAAPAAGTVDVVSQNGTALVLCDPHWICGLGCTTHKMLICLELSLAWQKPLVLCRPQYPLDGGWQRWFDIPRCTPPYTTTTRKLEPPMCLSSANHCEAERRRLPARHRLPMPSTGRWLSRPSNTSIVLRWDQSKAAQTAWLSHLRLTKNLALASRLVPHLVRPTAYLRQQLAAMKQRIGFMAPIVAVHIRRGDARQETRYWPVDHYFQRVARWAATLRSCGASCPSPGRPKVFLMADQPHVFRQVFSQYNSTYEVLSVDGGHTKKTWAERKTTVLAIYDVWLAAQADRFIGTGASQMGRLVTELLCARGTSSCKSRIEYVDGRNWWLT